MTDSSKLLSEFVQHASEPAFRELVTRHINLVYSTAIRIVAGDTHLAQDITQSVFTDLARKAKSVPPGIPLAGWLHRHTCFTAMKTIRGEQRRHQREKIAAEMNALQDNSEATLAQVAPALDEAIDQLGETDRTAILLRFFEQYDFRSLGAALGTNEDAARMRVTRALDKLRSLLKHRGVSLSVSTLATALTAEAVTAAPSGLALSITATAIASSVSNGIAFTLLKVLTTAKLTFGIICAVIVAGLIAFFFVQRDTEISLREQNRSLKQEIAQLSQLKDENARLSKLAAQPVISSLSEAQFREVVRLRGEVRRLRQQNQDLEKTVGNTNHESLTANPASSQSSAFQMFLVEDQAAENTQRMTNEVTNSDGKVFQEMVSVQKTPLLDHTSIDSARVVTNSWSGGPEIELVFTAQGRELFGAITRTNLDRRFAMVMNGQVYSIPVIKSAITGGKAMISGSFTFEEAENIASNVNSARSNR